jgi:hypothetical protein
MRERHETVPNPVNEAGIPRRRYPGTAMLGRIVFPAKRRQEEISKGAVGRGVGGWRGGCVGAMDAWTDGRGEWRRRFRRVAIRGVARWERATSSSLWWEAAPARPPKPTSTTPAEGFQRAVDKENFDAGASHWVDVV